MADDLAGSENIMQPSRVRMGPPKYAPHPNHPIHIHPVRPLYRFMATGLGASMWFFVCEDVVVEVDNADRHS